jgi:FkbM family methyltransferase
MKPQLWKANTIRRKLFEKLGSRKFSTPAFNGIDLQLSRIIGRNGYFVEAGAVDGVFESNTYYLERFLGWSGVLIEPVPEMFKRLATNRPKSISYNCALVPFDYSASEISINYAHALSTVTVNPTLQSELISVPARTLSSVIEDAALPRLDLLSLDVEGFEIEVLSGLSFDNHAPNYILIEALDPSAKARIDSFLSEYYVPVAALSYRDFLYKKM